jgi:uncharacterized protein
VDGDSGVLLDIPDDLRFFLPARLRGGAGVAMPVDGVSTLGHLVEAAGVPLPEVGGLVIDGRAVPVSYRPRGGEVVRVRPVARPQPVPGGPPRFLLDVHLGALARRMRLVGLDTAYHNDRDDPALVEQANAERRVLLTQDRGLLRRRNLWLGGYVRGTRADAQLADVLGRFELPELRPWTRCPACNGELGDVPKQEIEDELPPATREAYELFAECGSCGRLYWHGAHGGRLDAIVEAAVRASARS